MMWKKERGRRGVERVLALLLALVLMTGMLPYRAQAASWIDPYMEKVRDWGIMVGDHNGKLYPEKEITRAEFVTMVNRAFGYKKTGSHPFKDVREHDWFYEDISIGYKAGYFAGTGKTTASPNAKVTREQAITMLGRCMRIEGKVGVDDRFADSQKISNWARGIVQSAVDMGIVGGYNDGKFHPQKPITRGETASILVRALGNMIQTPGIHEGENYYGNLMITTPDVTLRNTTITGDLYISGGLGLESIVLENVKVMGRIIICGAGESQKGESSVIFRNVTAESLVLDTLQENSVSVRTEGLTLIPETTVRSSAFIEDVTEDGLGLSFIQMEGDREIEVHLAGNIKEVIDRAPGSLLVMAEGSAQKVTIDENAVDAELRVDKNANILETNLDRPSKVTGEGSLSHVNINAPGCEVEMLPDTIVVRPGIDAHVNGDDMDSGAAAESSEEPRILSGYPKIRNIAPTSADAVFSTNKKGTIYWALTAMTDGSVDNEEELISPNSYGSKIVKSGTVSVAESKKEMSAKLSGLIKDGSYYVSAILVDDRGHRSQIKVAAFTTPDDTAPNFAPGYPKAIIADDPDGETVIQAEVMTTKDCRLYYVLMPKGSVAPRPEDFKTGSLSGNLGWGQVDVHKNTPHLLPKINNSILKEQEQYDLYFWLSDVDNGKSSAVKKLTVTTPDKTPPKLIHLTESDVKDKSVSFTLAVDEPSTFYWAVVKKDAPFFDAGPDGKPLSRDELAAKIQIENGVGALKKGSVNVSKALTDVNFTITGLEPQTDYHLYYVVKDKSGNYMVYTESIEMPMPFKTQDNIGPDVTQEFSHDRSDGAVLTPYPDTSIDIIFTESVQGKYDQGGEAKYVRFDTKDPVELAEVLRHCIRLYRKNLDGQFVQVQERGKDAKNKDWIDYTKVQVKTDLDTGKQTVRFLHDNDDLTNSAINLETGVTYYIELEGIFDTSPVRNQLVDTKGGIRRLPEFTTIDAQMVFAPGASSGMIGGVDTPFDMSFKVIPQAVGSINEDVVWDMLIWSKYNIDIDIYYRDDGAAEWKRLGNKSMHLAVTPDKPELSNSLTGSLGAATQEPDALNQGFEKLGKMDKSREYGIIVKSYNGSDVRDNWSGSVELGVMPVSGSLRAVSQMSGREMTRQEYQQIQQGGNKVKEIGVPIEEHLECYFKDKNAPTFVNGYPQFVPGDTGVQMNIMLNRPNTTYYYVLAPVETVPTVLKTKPDFTTPYKETLTKDNWESLLPVDGVDCANKTTGNVSMPTSDSIIRGSEIYNGVDTVTGFSKTTGALKTENIDGKLRPNTQYVAYFVLRGESTESISEVFAFRFMTKEIDRPILNVSLATKSAATIASMDENGGKREADVRYMMIVSGVEGEVFNRKMENYWNGAAAAEYKLDPGTIARYKGMTLLEAMSTPYNRGSKNQGSVFDLFSTTDIQNTVTGLFESASTDGTSVVLVGDTSLNNGNNCQTRVECKGAMKPGKQKYWFVAMGKSPMGSASSFAAGRYLEWPEVKYPSVTTIGTELDKDVTVTDKYETAVNKSYSGTITLVFDDALYFNDRGKLKQVIDADKPNLSLDDKEKYIESTMLLTGVKNKVLPQKSQNDRSLCDTLVIKFTDIRPNSTISFRSELCNSTGSIPNKGLALKMTLVKNEEGFYMPTFEITVKEWDATIR